MNVEDELECCNRGDLLCNLPATFLELEDQHNIFLQTGEFVCLRNTVPLTIKLLNGKHLSCNATIVAQVLNVLNVPNEGSQVELNLLFRKTEFPSFLMLQQYHLQTVLISCFQKLGL